MIYSDLIKIKVMRHSQHRQFNLLNEETRLSNTTHLSGIAHNYANSLDRNKQMAPILSNTKDLKRKLRVFNEADVLVNEFSDTIDRT